MAVRFVVGRAGSGKTHHCLAEMRAELAADAADGCTLLLLVPEQAAFQMERTLIVEGQLPGTHRGRVASFRRLAHYIFQTVPHPHVRQISGDGRNMALRFLTLQLADRLRLYSRCGRMPGFVEQLSDSVAELLNENVSPEDLAVPDDAEADPLLAAKLHDLQLIYQAYLDYLSHDRIDPSQYLQAARQRIEACRWLHGAQIWIDGFAGFTEQERSTICELARVARHVDISMLLDGRWSGLDSPPAIGSEEDYDLFARTQRTYAWLHSLLTEANVPIDPLLRLDDDAGPRFANDELRRLERRLFAPSAEPVASQKRQHVRLYEAADRRVEVEAAVANVIHLTQRPDHPLRYREIAIIARDLESYHDLLSGALSSADVPFFIDRRRSTSHHPLVELLRGLVRLSAGDFDADAVRLLLKTGLLGIDEDRANDLENYVLAHGMVGRHVWYGADWQYGRSRRGLDKSESKFDRQFLLQVNATRKAFGDAIRAWDEFAVEQKGRSGRDWAAGLYAVLERLAVAEAISRWADDADADGDIELAEEHRQTWRDIVEFLDDFVEALGDQTMSPADLQSVLEAGLAGFTLGLAPPTVDQVLVGSIERSRHPNLRAAVIIGFNDGVFPRKITESGFLSDEDRGALARAGVNLGVTRRQRILDERMLAYIALTRAGEELTLIYALSGEQGEALEPSPFVSAVTEALPGLSPVRIGDPLVDRKLHLLHTSRSLAERLAVEFRSRTVAQTLDEKLTARWNALYDYVRRMPELSSTVRGVLQSLVYRNDACLTPDAVQTLFGGMLHTSVSRLEEFAACPFKHFADYGLKLEEREVFELGAVEVGTLHHAVLEEFVRRSIDTGCSITDISEDDLQTQLDEICRAKAATLRQDALLAEPRNEFLVSRSAADLSRVWKAQKRALSAGKFKPRGVEVRFGFEDDSLPPLLIDTPGGRRVELRGLIDRVDLADLGDELLGVVLDYKRTYGKRLNLTEVYNGLTLQLLGYLLVLAEHGRSLAGRPIKPVGAFYVPLVSRYTPVDHPADVTDDEAQRAEPYKQRGVLDISRLDAIDDGVQPGQRSSVVSASVKKSGEPGHLDSTDAAGAEEFAALLEHTRRKMGQLADGILDGCVNVQPYRLRDFVPCTWCVYRSVCRFEYQTDRVNRLEPLSRTEVLKRAKDQGGGA